MTEQPTPEQVTPNPEPVAHADLVERLLAEDCQRGRYDREAAAEILRLRAEIARKDEALRALAEGNLGPMPWQAGYDRIREVARAALKEQNQ